MMKSTAVCASTERLGVGNSTSPIPFLPWISIDTCIVSKLSVVDECAAPIKTGTSSRPNNSSNFNVFSPAVLTCVLPNDETTPIKSESGVAKAYANAKASSTPVSKSKIIFFFAIRISLLYRKSTALN